MTLRREAFLDHVRECGEYETLQEAERASRVKLALFGEVRAQLAARPPEEFALTCSRCRTPSRRPRNGSSALPRLGPPAAEVHCRYVAEWVGTKRRWSLSADVAEAAAVREVAADCPGTAVAYEPVP